MSAACVITSTPRCRRFSLLLLRDRVKKKTASGSRCKITKEGYRDSDFFLPVAQEEEYDLTMIAGSELG